MSKIKEAIKQAQWALAGLIDTLESEPEPTEFTEHLREQITYLEEMVRGEHPEEVVDWPEMFHQLWTACKEIDRLTAELKAKDGEIERLQDVITEYGRHDDECAMMTQMIETQPKCNCGFIEAWQGNQALKEKP